MDKIEWSILALIAALIIALGIWSCQNANLAPQLSGAKSEAGEHEGTIIYSGYSFQIHRVTIGGVNYLCNNNGGIVREE